MTFVTKDQVAEMIEIAKVNSVEGGVTLSRADGTVMSVQPDGVVEWRPAGTAGQYEKAQRFGNILVFSPSKSYAFALYE